MTTYTSCIDCGGPNYEEHRCMAGQLRQRDETIAKLKAGTCGHHPGMKCTEVHLDDKMKIEKLEAENAELKKKNNWDADWNKAWQHEIKVTAEQSATIRELEERVKKWRSVFIELKDYSPHCCEDCPCDYFRESAERALSELPKDGESKG